MQHNDPLMLLVPVVHIFLLLSGIPLYEYMKLFVILLVDTWATDSFGV